MDKEVISSKQGLCILLMFTMGSAIILAPWRKAGKDGWIAILIAMVMILPMVIVYSRLVLIFPGKDLFDMQQEVFGKIFGKLTSFFLVWYAIHLGAMIIRNFTEVIQVMNFTETPQFPIAIMIGVLSIWIVKGGIEVIGRWCAFMLLPVIISIVLVSLLLIPKMDLNNLRPVLYDGLNPVLMGAANAFVFPFAETFLFTAVFNSLRDKSKVFKLYFLNIIIAGCFMMMTSARNIMVLGEELNSSLYFPAYLTVSIINIKDFIDRIEVLVGGDFVFLGFVKLSVCLYASSLGFAKIFGIKGYRQVVAPIGLMMVIVSIFVYNSIMEMVEWADNNYVYYVIPFSVVIPLATLITAEIRVRSGRKVSKK